MQALWGEGAISLGKEFDIELEKDEYFFTQHRFDQLTMAREKGKVILDHNDINKGTVGAVALDKDGNLAAATSTGGMTNKKFGRIGDSAIIGSGTYANNNTCAVSCTGNGEYFIRAVAAHNVSALMEYGNQTLKEAVKKVVHENLKEIGGEGGLIAIDTQGNIIMDFNSSGMYRASQRQGEPVYSAIFS